MITHSLKKYLKHSPLFSPLVQSALSNRAKVRAYFGKKHQLPLIQAYLATPGVKKLQLGASSNVLDGWLNSDLEPRAGCIYLDVTTKFPLPDNTFDYVYSEHMIEHVPYQNGLFMIRECARVLKPGGTIRLVTPDMTVLLGLLNQPRNYEQEEFIRYVTDRFLIGTNGYNPVFVINNEFREWGHQFIYDEATLRDSLELCGFTGIKRFLAGTSDDPVLNDIENHGRLLGNEEINRFESLVLQATKS